MIMNRDREHLLGMVLADDVVIEGLADCLRGRNIVARFRQRRLVFLADDVHAKLDTLVANEDGGPGNELAHLVLALAAERAVERVLRIAAANLGHFRAALQDATVLVNFGRRSFLSRGHIIPQKELKEVLQAMPIENRPHRLSSRAQAHLNWLLDEALEQ